MTTLVEPDGPRLQRAAAAGRADVVEELLRAGDDPNQQNELGQTALHVSCGSGNVAVTSALLQHGAEASTRDFRHETALIKAAKFGHEPIIALFLQHTPSGVNVADCHQGSNQQHQDSIIKGFLQNVTARPKKVLRSLFSRFSPTGGPMSLINDEEESLVVSRTVQVNGNRAKKLGPCWEAVLRAAATEGHADIVRTLLQHDIELNAVDINGATALAIAAGYGHVEVMGLLLQHGASSNRKDVEGETPLLKAAWGAHLDCIRTLLQYGTSINQADNEGMTALHFAARKGNPTTVRFLLEEGADVHRMTGHGVSYCVDYPMLSGATPLHMAAWRGNSSILKDLLEAGSDIDSVTLMGQTCLHIATDTALYSGERKPRNSTSTGPNIEAMSYLLNEDCHTAIRDVDGNTPLDLTWTIGGHPQVAVVLLSHGAKFSQSKMADFRYLLMEDSGAELHLHICRAVLVSGNHGAFPVPPSEAGILFDRLRALSSVDDFSQWLHEYLFTPRPLKDLVRCHIRQTFIRTRGDRSIWKLVERLPLPPELCEFVLLRDLHDAAGEMYEHAQLDYSCDSSSYDNMSPQQAGSDILPMDPED